MVKKSEVTRTKWSISQLESHIRKESKDSSKVVFTEHALAQMKKRKIMMGCALETLRKGKISLPPELDYNTGDLKCRMEHYVAGSNIKIVVAISDEEPNLFIITAI